MSIEKQLEKIDLSYSISRLVEEDKLASTVSNYALDFYRHRCNIKTFFGNDLQDLVNQALEWYKQYKKL